MEISEHPKAPRRLNDKAYPWSKYNAQEYEWLRAEDSFRESITKNKPEIEYKYAQYYQVVKEPYYSLEDSKEPAGFQDMAVFMCEDKKFLISKRIVDLEGKGTWHVGDWFNLYVRGCCTIVRIVEQ